MKIDENRIDMRELSLFPLNTVLYPGMPLHLHIYEDRYRQMIRACMDHDQPFGVVMIRQGVEALGPLAIPYLVGTTARIASCEPLPGGRMNLMVIGVERFKIQTTLQIDPFLTAEVESMPLEPQCSLKLHKGTRNFRPVMEEYLKMLSRLYKEDMLDIQKFDMPSDPLMLLYMAAALLQVPMQEKQNLLEMADSHLFLDEIHRLYAREKVVLDHLGKISAEIASRQAWLN